MAKSNWKPTKHKGLRFREHPTRKHGIKKDRFFQFRHMVDGKRIEDSFGWQSAGWTEEKCILEMAKIKQAKRTGEGERTLSERRKKAEAIRKVEAKKNKQLELANKSFDNIWNEYFLSNSTKKDTTWQTEKGLYKNWIKSVIGHLPLNSVVKLHLQRIYKNMEKAGRSLRTIEYALVIVRQVFRFAVKEKLFFGEIPSFKKKEVLPKFDNRKKRYLSSEEASDLLSELATHSKDVHDMTLLSLYTGMRAGEIFSLNWGAVDIKNGRLTLFDTKNSETRNAYMTKQVQEMFLSRTPGAPNDLVFPGRGGKKIIQISDTFNHAVNKLGFNDGVVDRRQKVTFHTCRHSNASWLVANGTPLYYVKEILGHKSLQTTARYSHVNDKELEAAVRGLEEQQEHGGAEVIQIQNVDAVEKS